MLFYLSSVISLAAQVNERLKNLREDETGGRDMEGYDDDPGAWMVRSWRIRELRGFKIITIKIHYCVVDALRDVASEASLRQELCGDVWEFS